MTSKIRIDRIIFNTKPLLKILGYVSLKASQKVSILDPYKRAAQTEKAQKGTFKLWIHNLMFRQNRELFPSPCLPFIARLKPFWRTLSSLS